MGYLDTIIGAAIPGTSEKRDKVFGIAPFSTDRDLSLLTPEQQELMTKLREFLGQPIEGTLSGTEAGSLAALEEQALSRVSGEGAAGAAGTFLEDVLQRGPTDIDSFFDTNIRDPLLEDFNEIILPNIGKRFAGQFFSGERQEAERRGLEDLLGTLGSERSRVALEGRRADTDAGLTAASTAGQLDEGMLNLLATIFGAGGREQQLEQGQIDNILAALGIKGKENIVTVNPGTTGLLSSFLGGGGGAAIGELFASSEGFKTDQKPAEDVLPKLADMRIERWKYDEFFEDNAEHIGPYAEEFHAAFDTPSDKTIPVIDAIGVALKGVQELGTKMSAMESALAEI